MTTTDTTIVLTPDAFRRAVRLSEALREQAREMVVSFQYDNASRARTHRAKLGELLAVIDALLAGEEGRLAAAVNGELVVAFDQRVPVRPEPAERPDLPEDII